MKKSAYAGFTLIELLLVIAISPVEWFRLSALRHKYGDVFTLLF